MKYKNLTLKKYIYFFIVLCVIIFSLLFWGCNKNEDMNPSAKLQLTGVLIFTDNSRKLYKYDLNTTKIDTILNNRVPGRIIKISPTEFMAEGYFDGFGKLDIKNGNCTYIRNGSRLCYIKSHKKIFFYEFIREEKVHRLCMASIDSPDKLQQTINTIKEFNYFSYLFPPVQISENEIVCLGEDSNLWQYNISTEILTPTGISGKYTPQAWISKHNTLLCKFRGEGSIHTYEINWENKNIIARPMLNSMYYSKYLDKYDMIIYGTRTYGLFGELSAERYDTFIYSFKDNFNIKLISHIGISSAVYLDE